MRIAVRKLGNSAGVIIPKSVLSDCGIGAGDSVDLTTEQGRIILAPVKRHPREGWAEAFDEPPELTEEERTWLGFPNDSDNDWRW